MQRVYGIEILFRDSPSKTTGHPLYPGFQRESKIIPKGSVLQQGALALPCDILWERDLAIELRDGTTIYADVYRPPHAKVLAPAIISSGGFGKNGGLNRKLMNEAPWRHGVPQKTVSSLEKFEGPDPAYWCLHGYAMVHPDTRGSWMSEGDTYVNCTLDGRDGYDIVEWVASQPWSNKRVTMAGNSWLSQTQWFVGAEQPPHLSCLAPWEGWSDLYNDSACRGGIPSPEFQQGLMNNCFPNLARTEDVAAMTAKYPTWNPYWEDRRARCDKITVPMYIVASWTNALHTRGTFRGWLQSTASANKWLRVHNSHEWPDLYNPQNVEDLRRFYDHYMKDESNGWEFTPKVRLSVLNPGHKDVVNRPEAEFPLARQLSRRLFLDVSRGALAWETEVKEPTCIRFEATKGGVVTFDYTFSQRTELTGYFKLLLWVQAVGNDDIDLFAKFSKLDSSGNLMESNCIDPGYLSDDPEADRKKLVEIHDQGRNPHTGVYFSEGAHGRLRVSHRELDQTRSTPHQPHYTHANLQKLRDGEIVPVEIELWPHGMIWERGEKIRLSVAGHNMRPELTPRTPAAKTLNKGEVVVYTGGKYDSHLLVPYIPSS